LARLDNIKLKNLVNIFPLLLNFTTLRQHFSQKNLRTLEDKHPFGFSEWTTLLS